MLIKFFKNGQGGGARPVGYLVAREVLAYDDNRDVLRGDNGKAVMITRDPLPEVLRGNADTTRALIDASPHQWSYRAGVIAFTQEDAPSQLQQREVMDAFEALAFAGLDADQRDILWVRHSHEHRVELHFCTPRIELESGKSFNIAPPGYQKSFDALRDCLNKERGWADPQDPERARDVVSIIEQSRRGEAREIIHDWVLDKITDGTIQDRASMVAALRGAGFELPRAGKEYLTVLDPETQDRFRLKGHIFHETWTRQAELKRAAGREPERNHDTGGTVESRDIAGRGRIEPRRICSDERGAGTRGDNSSAEPSSEPFKSRASTGTRRLDQFELGELQARLAEFVEQRAAYNRARYCQIASRQQSRDPDHQHGDQIPVERDPAQDAIRALGHGNIGSDLDRDVLRQQLGVGELVYSPSFEQSSEPSRLVESDRLDLASDAKWHGADLGRKQTEVQRMHCGQQAGAVLDSDRQAIEPKGFEHELTTAQGQTRIPLAPSIEAVRPETILQRAALPVEPTGHTASHDQPHAASPVEPARQHPSHHRQPNASTESDWAIQHSIPHLKGQNHDPTNQTNAGHANTDMLGARVARLRGQVDDSLRNLGSAIQSAGATLDTDAERQAGYFEQLRQRASRFATSLDGHARAAGGFIRQLGARAAGAWRNWREPHPSRSLTPTAARSIAPPLQSDRSIERIAVAPEREASKQPEYSPPSRGPNPAR